MTTTEPTSEDLQSWHPAEPDDWKCACGDRAVVVYVRSDGTKEPYCGVRKGGDNHPGERLSELASEKWDRRGTAEERVVVVPEVTIPANLGDAQERAWDVLKEVTPKLEELRAAMQEVCDAYTDALVALWPHMADKRHGQMTDTMHQLASDATGWDALWTAVGWIGEVFGDDSDLAGPSMSLQEIARGGERDFPLGTIAVLARPGQATVRVVVEKRPSAMDGDKYRVRDLDSENRYSIPHDQLAGGVELVELIEKAGKSTEEFVHASYDTVAAALADT